jgi:hypothetical protein
MSTVDPAAERKKQAHEDQGSALALILLLFSALLLVAAGIVLGYAIGGLGDQARTMALHGISGTNNWLSALPIWTMPVSIVLSPLALALYSGSVQIYFGHEPRGLVPGTLVLWAVAATVTLWWVCRNRWFAPDAPGTHTGVTWFAATASWWLPGLATIGTLVLILRQQISRHRVVVSRRTLEDLLRNGSHVVGEVTEVRGVVPRGGEHRKLDWTFRFRDGAGTDRWVERAHEFTLCRYPREGQEVRVVFDPRDPSDQRRIAVSLVDSTDSADYLL